MSIFTSAVVVGQVVMIAQEDTVRDQKALCPKHSILSFDATLSLSINKKKSQEY
jgi:hypothetical protein